MIKLQRAIEKDLELWKEDPDRKPLLLRGARQVGKSFVVQQFGERYFRKIHTFNFDEKLELKKIFAGDLHIETILRDLEISARTEINLNEDLIFFDEIQECTRAISCLRYFKEKLPEAYVIAAGSLLEFVLDEISIPVGRIDFLNLYPLSFGEFLDATKRSSLTKLLPKLQEGRLSEIELTETASSQLYRALREYMVVGGMPECVASYAKKISFERIQKIQSSLVESFQADVLKYTKGSKQISNIQWTWIKLSKLVGNEITYSTINPDDDYKRTKHSLELLAKAKLIHIVRSTNPDGLPLGASSSDKRFKCLFLDIGLMFYLAGGSVNELMDGDLLLDAMQGRLAEQFVGQQLLSGPNLGSERGSLYCWIRPEHSAKAEIDYVVQRNGSIIPIEVKSGKGGKLRSLKQYLQTYPNTSYALCLQERLNVQTSHGITYAPLFSVI